MRLFGRKENLSINPDAHESSPKKPESNVESSRHSPEDLDQLGKQRLESIKTAGSKAGEWARGLWPAIKKRATEAGVKLLSSPERGAQRVSYEAGLVAKGASAYAKDAVQLKDAVMERAGEAVEGVKAKAGAMYEGVEGGVASVDDWIDKTEGRVKAGYETFKNIGGQTLDAGGEKLLNMQGYIDGRIGAARSAAENGINFVVNKYKENKERMAALKLQQERTQRLDELFANVSKLGELGIRINISMATRE